MSGLRSQPGTARDKVFATSGRSSIAVRGFAGLVVAIAIASTWSDPVAHVDAAWGFGAVIAIGELLRITYPTGRVQAPLALSGGLAYALLCSLQKFESITPSHVITVAAIGMVVGAVPHAVAKRAVDADGIAQRVLVVAAVAGFHCFGPAQLLSDAPRDRPLQALVMFGALVVGFLVDRAVMAVLMLGRGGTSFVRQFANEVRLAPGIALSVAVTAVALAIASQIIPPLWAIPLFSIPLVLTQTSYRRYNGARATYAQTIEALSRATELAGYTTLGHARRVADLSVRVGTALDLSPVQLSALEQAALLHDLGQMTLPHPLPGGVTATLPLGQRQELATAGARLIEEALVPGDIATVVGRQADDPGVVSADTPVASRIIAVANAYDDLRHGLGVQVSDDEVVREISADTESRYDPAVVRAVVDEINVRRHPRVGGWLAPATRNS